MNDTVDEAIQAESLIRLQRVTYDLRVENHARGLLAAVREFLLKPTALNILKLRSISDEIGLEPK